MTERMNHSGENPEEFRRPVQPGLTGDTGRKYAESGDIYMAEGSGGSAENLSPQDFTRKERQNPQDRDWQSDFLSNPNRQEASFSSPVSREDLRKAWAFDHFSRTNRMEMTDEEKRTYEWAVENDARPSWFQAGGRPPGEQIQLSPRDREQRDREVVREASSNGERISNAVRIPPPGLTDEQERIWYETHQDPLSPHDPTNPNRPQPESGERPAFFVKPLVREEGYGGERKITSAEVMAEEIMKFGDTEKWGTAGVNGITKDGTFPLLKKFVKDGVVQRVNDPENIHNGKEIYVIDEANFMRWVRDQMMYWHIQSPDEAHDFGSKVQVTRDFNSFNLSTIINNASRYLRSEATQETLNGLNEQIQKEMWLFGESRKMDIQYKGVMGSDEDLPKAISQLFYGNTFTKTVWEGKSTLYWIMQMPEEFREPTVGPDGKEVKSKDNNLGRALNLAYHTYYNISDYDKLQELLGADTQLLNPRAFKEMLISNAEREGVPIYDYIDPEIMQNLDTWDMSKNKDKDEYMKVINIFNQNGKPGRIVSAVSRLVELDIANKFNLKIKKENGEEEIDETSAAYANTFALSMARWTGAGARNDVGAQGYDAWTRLLVTDEYRKKQPVDSRGGVFGNPYNINLMKQLSTDLFGGISVQAVHRFDGVGGNVPKTALDVFEEMEKAQTPEEYDKAASQLVFSNNAMRGFALDHLGRSFKIFQQLQGSEDIKFDKFTSYDHINGLKFDRAAFDEALKDKFFKPMRYAYSTYSGVNMGKIIRTDTDGKGHYKDMRLAEAMFGRQVIDGLNDGAHGQKLYKKGFEHVSINSPEWENKIDWEWVSSRDGKVALWRQVALARLAAEFYAHKDRHSTDPRYNWYYYKEVIEVLEKIPNEIIGDDTDLQSSKAVGQFFKHHDIEWLRKASSTEEWKLYRQAIISDVFKGSGEGFKKALKQFFEYTFKG